MLFFQPFEGSGYRQGFRDGLRLLVLAESHYVPGLEPGSNWHDPAYTNEVVADGWTERPDAGYHYNFWGRLHRVLSGLDEPTEADARQAWSRIAYSNYIQMPVGPAASSRKTREHWKSGEAALPELLQKLEPDRVLILGKGTWNHIHLGRWIDPAWSAASKDRGLWGLALGERLIPSTWVSHPSWGRESVPDMRRVLSGMIEFRSAP